jgi:hypothetical protein
MDSAAIASELEKLYPTPSVSYIPSHSQNTPMPGAAADPSNPASAQMAEWAQLHMQLAKPIRPLLSTRSVEVVTDYSRPKKLAGLGGKSLEDFLADIDVAKCLEDMRQPLREMNDFWERNWDLLYPGGKLSWTAVHQLSALQSVKVSSPDIFKHIMEAEEGKGIQKLYTSAKENGLFDRDDH